MELYPSYVKKFILKELKKEGSVIDDEKDVSSMELFSDIYDRINVTEFKTLDEKFRFLLDYDKILSVIEEYDYRKPYRHFCYFKCSNLQEEKIKLLIDEGKIIVFNPKEQKPVDEFDDEVYRPTIYQLEDQIFFKFSYHLKDKLNDESIKYVMLAIFDKRYGLLEIRFDRVGVVYKYSQTYYKDQIASILEYFHNYLELQIEYIDFKAVVEHVFSTKTDITIVAKRMLRNGTMAHLEAYEDEETVLPILGELENLIEDNKSLFERNDDTKSILQLLEHFLKEIDVKSDMPVVKIRIDDSGIKFGITHNYKDTEYSLFMLYGELIGEEMMNHVKDYVMRCYREFGEAISSNPLPTKEI